jgi:hypothetical protein
MFSFNTRKKRLEVQRFLRRAIDTTTPNVPPYEGNTRKENRSNRSTPVLLVPFDDGVAVAEKAIYALTKDLSGDGIALVLRESFSGNRVVIGFMLDGLPGFALGDAKQNVLLGGGFWQLGVELVELISPHSCESLEALVPLVERLAPSTDQQTAAAH